MATNPVTTDDVVARWRPLADDELTIATTLLADAWVLANNEIPDLGDRLDAETLDTAVVKMVFAAAVRRVMSNTGYVQLQEMAGPNSRMIITDESSRQALMVSFTEDELGRLRGSAASTATSNAFTISAVPVVS